MATASESPPDDGPLRAEPASQEPTFGRPSLHVTDGSMHGKESSPFGDSFRRLATGSAKFIQELREVNHWLTNWNHSERCALLKQLLKHMSSEQRRSLAMLLYPLHMKDMLIMAERAYPGSRFMPVYLPERGQKQAEEMTKYNAAYRAWLIRQPKICREAVSGVKSIDKDPRLTSAQRERRRAMLKKSLSTRPYHPQHEDMAYLSTEADVEEHHKLYAASHTEDEKLTLELKWWQSRFTDDTSIERRTLRLVLPDTFDTGLPGVDRRCLLQFTEDKLKMMSLHQGSRADHVTKPKLLTTSSMNRRKTGQQQQLPSLPSNTPKIRKTPSSPPPFLPCPMPVKKATTPRAIAAQATGTPHSTHSATTTPRQTPRRAASQRWGNLEASSTSPCPRHFSPSVRLTPVRVMAASARSNNSKCRQSDWVSESDSESASSDCDDSDTERAEEDKADGLQQQLSEVEAERSGQYEDLEICHPVRMHAPWLSTHKGREWTKYAADAFEQLGTPPEDSIVHPVTPEGGRFSCDMASRLQADQPMTARSLSRAAMMTPAGKASSTLNRSHHSRLPANGKTLLHRYISSWTETEQEQAIYLILTQLDARELFYIVFSIVPYTYCDFVSLLPSHLAVCILQYLTPDELRIASQVCKRWHRVAFSTDVWWFKYKELSRQTGVSVQFQQQHRDPNWLNLAMRIERVVHHWNKPLIQYTRMKVHRSRILGFNVDEERNLLATACHDGSVAVLDISSCFKWTVLHRFVPDKHTNCWCVALFGMQVVIGGYSDGCLRYWSWTTKTIAKTVKVHRAGTIYCMQIKAERMIIGCKNHHAYVFDVRCPNLPRCVLRGHKGEVYAVQLSNKATRAYTGSRDSSVREWQVSSGDCLRALNFERPVLGLSLHKGILSVCSSSDAVLLDCTAKTWKPSKPFQGHIRRIEDVSYIRGPHPRGHSLLVTSGKDSMVFIHDASRPGQPPIKQLFTHHFASVVSVHATTTAIFALAGSRVYMWRFDGPAAFSYE
ncbi:F-box/WD repeat-containing protein 7-like isoform X1 [Sycon ciliatum]|uniref:F-box/WD repeat-containing protein 7-like isoform X1 n=2 Tax=Sycon ciliatum TaxID=27933 RepID=UPI0031F65EA8